MFIRLSYVLRVLIILFTFCGNICAQADSITVDVIDTTSIIDTLVYDSIPPDSLINDSIKVSSDSIIAETKEPFLEAEVNYTSTDSMTISMDGQKFYLYNDAEVTYTDIVLKANYIEFDMSNQEVFAKGVADSSGMLQGTPVFTQGGEEFEADSLKYNFKSGKGIIYQVSSQQAEGILHSEKTKRSETGHVHVRGGKYTTCDAEHPHFYLALSKAIVMPEDKIITGPSYFVVADIPTPLIIPFGFFPNTTNRSSGILIPTYGEENSRGFFLRQAGWYQTLGDYADYTIRGDIYSKGSWALYNDLAYKWKYKFNGSLALDYAVLKNNDDAAYRGSKQFKFTWRHTQDPKANPTSQFSANVNFQSTDYDKQNSYTYSDYLNQSRSSSVSYRKNWPGTPFNLSLSALASQNSGTKTTNLSLPSGSFNANRVYPFRWLNTTTEKKWFDDIGFSYSAQFANKINTTDSLLFNPSTYEHTNFGLSHNVPIFMNIKTGRIFNISPSLSYTGRLYNFQVDKSIVESSTGIDSVVTDTIWKYDYAHGINPSISFSFNPKVYGMYINKRPDPKIIAVRHTISPTASFSYVPDMRKIFSNYPDYYNELNYFNSSGDSVSLSYSIFEKNMYGTPTANGQSGSFRFSLSQNVEGKRIARKDTTGEARKFPIIESLNMSTSYNPFAKQISNTARAWSDISAYGSTSLLNKKLSLNARGAFSMYGYDTTGATLSDFIWDVNNRYLRLTTFSLSASVSFRSQQKKGDKDGEVPPPILPVEMLAEEMYQMQQFTPGAYYGGDYVNFNVPWSLSFSYNWNYNQSNPMRASRVQTIAVRGDISLTDNWKIGGNTNFDIESKDFSFTNLRIHRNLHCFEMNFTIVPFGSRKSYTFVIRAKASMLKDLKLDKKHSWFDNF